MTPVYDFSEIPDMETMHTEVSEDGIVLRYYSPWTGAMSPAGDQLLMVNDLGGVMGMMAAPLPPTGELPKVIYTSEEYSSFGETRASTASDGKVLAYSTCHHDRRVVSLRSRRMVLRDRAPGPPKLFRLVHRSISKYSVNRHVT